MGNHAALIRQENAGLTVTRRGRRFVEFALPDGRTRHVAAIDPLHIRDSETEIDTGWVADTGAWQWKIAAADYQAHARSVFNVGSLYEWRKGDQWIVVDPQSINWINQDNSRQQIAIKQAVTGQANDCTLSFPAAYGAGRHFEYTAHPRRLIKHVILDSLAALPTPTITGTIQFEVEFSITNSAGIELYLDGVRWARANNVRVRTSNRIEFKTGDTAEPLWYADAPFATDANGETVAAQYEVQRVGGTYFIRVRVPREWMLTAAYPVIVDPTFTDGYGGDATTYIDNYTREDAADVNLSTVDALGTRADSGYRRNALLKFVLSSLSGATINSATLTLVNLPQSSYTVTRTATIHAILSGNASWTEDGSKWNYATGTTRWAGDTGADGGADAGCSVSGTDYNGTSMGGWTYLSTDVVGAEYAVALNTTQFTALVAANYGLVAVSADADWKNAVASSDHATTGYRPKLVVEYTTGGGEPLSIAITPELAAYTVNAPFIVG